MIYEAGLAPNEPSDENSALADDCSLVRDPKAKVPGNYSPNS